MSDDISQRLAPIFEEVFGHPVTITRDLDAAKVEEWDSLNHINLVVAIESAFGVELTAEELEQMLNVGDLIDILERKLG